MKWFVLTSVIVLTLFVGAILLHNLSPPDFKVHQFDTSDDGVRITIKPNFVVNSIYQITVAQSDRTLLSRDTPKRGLQVFDLPDGLAAGDVLTVRCDLQYDQWMAPSITTIEKQIVLK